jgi:hypothetical protein
VCVCVWVKKMRLDLYKECTVAINIFDMKIIQIRPKTFGVDPQYQI